MNGCIIVTVQVQMGSSHLNTVCLMFFLLFPDTKEKPKPKMAVDLFDEDDEDGDIFSNKYSVPTPAQSKEVVLEEQTKPPEKKVKSNT